MAQSKSTENSEKWIYLALGTYYLGISSDRNFSKKTKNLPVPFEAFMVILVEEMNLWSCGSDIRMQSVSIKLNVYVSKVT